LVELEVDSELIIMAAAVPSRAVTFPARGGKLLPKPTTTTATRRVCSTPRTSESSYHMLEHLRTCFSPTYILRAAQSTLIPRACAVLCLSGFLTELPFSLRLNTNQIFSRVEWIYLHTAYCRLCATRGSLSRHTPHSHLP
jgi:hypothetical protein